MNTPAPPPPARVAPPLRGGFGHSAYSGFESRCGHGSRRCTACSHSPPPTPRSLYPSLRGCYILLCLFLGAFACLWVCALVVVAFFSPSLDAFAVRFRLQYTCIPGTENRPHLHYYYHIVRSDEVIVTHVAFSEPHARFWRHQTTRDKCGISFGGDRRVS